MDNWHEVSWGVVLASSGWVAVRCVYRVYSLKKRESWRITWFMQWQFFFGGSQTGFICWMVFVNQGMQQKIEKKSAYSFPRIMWAL